MNWTTTTMSADCCGALPLGQLQPFSRLLRLVMGGALAALRPLTLKGRGASLVYRHWPSPKTSAMSLASPGSCCFSLSRVLMPSQTSSRIEASNQASTPAQ